MILWGLVMLLFAGLWMRVVPPGGVSWPFFTLAVAIPAGAVLARRRGAVVWQIALYAFVTGAFFAAGVVFDGREDLRVRFGEDSKFGSWSRLAAVAGALWITTVAAAPCFCRSRSHGKPTEMLTSTG